MFNFTQWTCKLNFANVVRDERKTKANGIACFTAQLSAQHGQTSNIFNILAAGCSNPDYANLITAVNTFIFL